MAASIERAGRSLGSLLLLLAAGIGGFLWWDLSQMAFYGGLSAISCGLFVYAAMSLPGTRPGWRRAGQVAAVALAAKVFLEISLHTARPFIPVQGFVPLPQSHATGMLIALLYWASEKTLRNRRAAER